MPRLTDERLADLRAWAAAQTRWDTVAVDVLADALADLASECASRANLLAQQAALQRQVDELRAECDSLRSLLERAAQPRHFPGGVPGWSSD